MNTTKLNYESTTIIDDGQFRYPVETAALEKWESENGKITPSNYQDFCDAVETSLPDVIPGSAEMIDVCAALLECGARIYRPA